MCSYYSRFIRLISVFGILVLPVTALAACGNSSDEETTEAQVGVSSQLNDEKSSEEETSEPEEESSAKEVSKESTPEPPVDTEEGAEISTEQPVQRIQFATGDIGAVIEGSILQDDRTPVYVLSAIAQQLMQVTLTSLQGTVSLDIESPNGEKLVTGITKTKTLLPADGDYLIYINSLSGDAKYSLDVLITSVVEYVSVQFQAGTSSATVSGGILRGEAGPVYGLVAAAGQRMEITITSLEENASFDVLRPSGEYLISEIAGQEFEFSAILPEDGEYLITTNALRGNVSFDLNISILD